MDFKTIDLLCISPIIFLFIMSIIPISVKAFRNGREMTHYKALAWGLIGVFGAMGLTFVAVQAYWNASGLNFIEVFSKTLIVDGITIFSSYIILGVVGFCLFLLYDSKATRDLQFSEHLFLVMNGTIGMILIVMSNNLLMTFIALELMSLSSYLLIALNKERILSKEASFKYFVLGSLGSAIFLYGIAFVFGGAGSVNIHVVGELTSQLYQSSPIFRFGVIMTVIGFAFKVSLVPFHSWTPDVYQGAATPITSVMSTAIKVASFVAFLRFFLYSDFFDVPSEYFLNFMQWIAALTMIVGNVAAIRQVNFKRMLAYSSIAHSGYIFMGIIAATFGSDSERGISAMLFYLFSYAIMTVGTLALAVVYEKSENTILLIDDLKGTAKKSPWVAISLSLLLFSLAGLPPSLGFFGKFYVFSAAVEQGLYWLTFVGVMSSAIGVYYYLRPIVVMYMVEGSPVEENKSAVFSKPVLIASALTVTVFGIFSSNIYEVVRQSVEGSL